MESAGRTLVCSILFLDIADYSSKPVAEQLQPLELVIDGVKYKWDGRKWVAK